MNTQERDRAALTIIVYFKYGLSWLIPTVAISYVLSGYGYGMVGVFVMGSGLFIGCVVGMVKSMEAGSRFAKSLPPEDFDTQEGTALGSVRAKLKNRRNLEIKRDA